MTPPSRHHRLRATATTSLATLATLAALAGCGGEGGDGQRQLTDNEQAAYDLGYDTGFAHPYENLCDPVSQTLILNGTLSLDDDSPHQYVQGCEAGQQDAQ